MADFDVVDEEIGNRWKIGRSTAKESRIVHVGDRTCKGKDFLDHWPQKKIYRANATEFINDFRIFELTKGKVIEPSVIFDLSRQSIATTL